MIVVIARGRMDRHIDLYLQQHEGVTHSSVSLWLRMSELSNDNLVYVRTREVEIPTRHTSFIAPYQSHAVSVQRSDDHSSWARSADKAQVLYTRS